MSTTHEVRAGRCIAKLNTTTTDLLVRSHKTRRVGVFIVIDPSDRLANAALLLCASTMEEKTAANTSPAGQASPPKYASNNIPKAIIKNVDMSDDMQQVAVDVASEALVKFTVEKDIAAHVKKTMDAKYGPTWHAVVGKNYGSYVTHGELEGNVHALSLTFPRNLPLYLFL